MYEKNHGLLIVGIIFILFASISWWDRHSKETLNPKDGVVFQIQKKNCIAIRIGKKYLNLSRKNTN